MALASLGALRGEDAMAALRGTQEAAERAGFGLLEALGILTITNALEGSGRQSSPFRRAGRAWPGPGSSAWARQIAAPIAGNLAESLTSAGRWTRRLEILDEVLGLDLPPLGRFGPLVIRAQIAVARGTRKRPNGCWTNCARCRPACRRRASACLARPARDRRRLAGATSRAPWTPGEQP